MLHFFEVEINFSKRKEKHMVTLRILTQIENKKNSYKISEKSIKHSMSTTKINNLNIFFYDLFPLFCERYRMEQIYEFRAKRL